MRFGFQQEWDATPWEIIEVYTDEVFWRSLQDMSSTSAPDVLGIRHDDTTVTVELRHHLVVDLPREAARFIDVHNVSWVEISTWNLPTGRCEINFRPDQASRLMRAKASAQVSNSTRGTTRAISGELKVSIPLLGSRVERAIISGIGEHLAEEALEVERFLG